MPEIEAFRGLRYDLGHVGALSDVVAPPYDVIDQNFQDALYKRHPANVVRLILNRVEPGDDDNDNRYARAARFLKNVPFVQVHSSTLRRCRQTVRPIAEGNIGRPKVVYSDYLRETALGVLEGELIDLQSTAELTQHYQNFSSDEICYRVPKGENLHDVSTRVKRFFADQCQLLNGQEIYLIVGHRNVNKMILKSLLGLSFEEGFRVEHEHQRLYFYFGASKELWSSRVGGTSARFTQGYVTTNGSSYA